MTLDFRRVAVASALALGFVIVTAEPVNAYREATAVAAQTDGYREILPLGEGAVDGLAGAARPPGGGR